MPGRITQNHMDKSHPLFCLFYEQLADSLKESFGQPVAPGVHDYVTCLLVGFMRSDEIFRMRDNAGRETTSVIEMAASGDVRLGASNFEQEREVHKHIGDYILFWTGINPKFLEQGSAPFAVPDYARQGISSYRIAASFDYPPHQEVAPVLGFLSDEFVGVAEALQRFGSRFRLAG